MLIVVMKNRVKNQFKIFTRGYTLTKNVDRKKQIFLQKKLSYYLRRYRMKNNITSKENALRLGYVPSRYCDLESETKPYPRLISIYEFLSKLSSLEGMTPLEFLEFLDGAPHSVVQQKMKWKEPLLEIAATMPQGQKDLLRTQLTDLDKDTVKLFQACMEIFIYAKLYDVPNELLIQLSSLIRRTR